jgi:hypothetical protein
MMSVVGAEGADLTTGRRMFLAPRPRCRAPFRRLALAMLVGGPRPGIAFNEHHAGDGDIVYRPACKLGCEGRRAEAPRCAPGK